MNIRDKDWHRRVWAVVLLLGIVYSAPFLLAILLYPVMWAVVGTIVGLLVSFLIAYPIWIISNKSYWENIYDKEKVEGTWVLSVIGGIVGIVTGLLILDPSENIYVYGFLLDIASIAGTIFDFFMSWYDYLPITSCL